MENQAKDRTTTKSSLWYSIGILVTAFSFIVLITVFCFSFYRIAFVFSGVQSQVDGMSARVNQMETTVANSQQQITDELKQAMNQLQQASDQTTWHVIDAQYYVKLANAQLEIGNNVQTAIQLLQTADKEIENINNPKLDPIRKALAEDIANLQAAPQVDYTGLYMRISAMNEQITKLPLLTRPVEANTSATVNNADESWWRRGLNDTWQALQKIVVVRYHATGVPPLVTPDQQEFLQQNLHAMLEKAMWAVLNKNNDIYRASLQQAIDWINQYYMKDSSVTESVVSNLNQLQQMDVHPTLPRVTASMQAFHDYFL